MVEKKKSNFRSIGCISIIITMMCIINVFSVVSFATETSAETQTLTRELEIPASTQSFIPETTPSAPPNWNDIQPGSTSNCVRTAYSSNFMPEVTPTPQTTPQPQVVKVSVTAGKADVLEKKITVNNSSLGIMFRIEGSDVIKKIGKSIKVNTNKNTVLLSILGEDKCSVLGYAYLDVYANYASKSYYLSTEADYSFDIFTGTITKYRGVGKNIIIPDTIDGYTVKRIGESAFYDCNELKSVMLPDSITVIEDFAFARCDNLVKINIPKSVTSINTGVFMDSISLQRLDIPTSVTNIGDSVFSGCSSLRNINVDSSNPNYSSVDGILLNKNGNKMILYPLRNKSDDIPKCVTIIGNRAFARSNITQIKIPSNIKIIENKAFVGCYNLKTVNIPKSVIEIQPEAFIVCKNLTTFNVDKKNQYYSSVGEMILNKDGTTLILCSGGRNTYTIPNSVKTIGHGAFTANINLTNITIPNNVEQICDYAFFECYNLASIILPENLTSISGSVFGNCSKLTSIIIPRNVTFIDDYAFWTCTNLTIYGYENSYAQNYANKNGIPFVFI